MVERVSVFAIRIAWHLALVCVPFIAVPIKCQGAATWAQVVLQHKCIVKNGADICIGVPHPSASIMLATAL